MIELALIMGVYFSAGQKFRPMGIGSCLNSWLWPNIWHYGLFVLRNSATPLEIYCENALFQAVWHKNVCHVKKCRSPLLGMLKETQWGATRLSPEYIRQSILSFFVCVDVTLFWILWLDRLFWPGKKHKENWLPLSRIDVVKKARKVNDALIVQTTK